MLSFISKWYISKGALNNGYAKIYIKINVLHVWNMVKSVDVSVLESSLGQLGKKTWLNGRQKIYSFSLTCNLQTFHVIKSYTV